MKVENLRLETNGDGAKAVATVRWEDCARPAQELYFGTTAEFAGSLSCNPDAFLVACIMPAMHFGEQRLSIEGDICPELRVGLWTAMHWMRLWWYEPARELVRIEAKTRTGPPSPRIPDRAGVFFSGGIDALATVRANRLSYPPEHPGSIKDGLLVRGLEVRDPGVFGHVWGAVSALAGHAGATLIPIDTNIRELGPVDDREFWGRFWLEEFMGACLSSVAHAFARRLTRASINSDYDVTNVIPLGSHPLVDPNYSSNDLAIRHEGITMSRFEKTRLVSGWGPALRHLRVCNRTELYQPGRLNCSNCEKCVRTMLALLALGVLDRAEAFPVREVSEELVMATVTLQPSTFPLYRELIAPLEATGRHDLVRAIRRKMAEHRRREARKARRRALIEPIVGFDERKLGGILRKVKRAVRPGKGICSA